MAIQVEIVIIAALVSLAIIIAGKAIITGRAISRRPSHHLATRAGASPVPPEVDLRPPG
jgi:hypothetical protein